MAVNAGDWSVIDQLEMLKERSEEPIQSCLPVPLPWLLEVHRKMASAFLTQGIDLGQ